MLEARVQRIPLITVGSPLVATGGVALAALAWRDRFPAGVASHVGPSGLVDDVTTAGTFAATALTIGAGLALLWGLLARSVRSNPTGLRVLAAASVGSAAVLAAGPAVLLVTSLDRGRVLGEPAPGWLLPVVAALLAPTTSVRVTVDHTGVSVHPTLVPRPRVHVPLTRVVRAGRSDVRARELGGWGLRMRGERTAVLLRSGEALDLELADGSRFLVTVDDAATAAALVNTLAERSRVC